MASASQLKQRLPAPKYSSYVVPEEQHGEAGLPSASGLAGTTDASQQLVAHAGANQSRLVHAKFGDLVERAGSDGAVETITYEEEEATADRTAAALAKLVGASVAASRAVQLPTQSEDRHKYSEFVHYKPDADAPGFNPAASQRVIRVVEAPVDPLEPPKFKHKKIPRGQGSPPVPVMHAPAKKLTAADQEAWDIPPVVSNYKNPKGFSVSLDKRATMDGRALLQVEASDRFAAMAETLHLTRQAQARELELRAAMRRREREEARRAEDAKIRELAAQQRAERAGLLEGEGEGEVGAAMAPTLPGSTGQLAGASTGASSSTAAASAEGAGAGQGAMSSAELAREAMREVRKRLRAADEAGGAGDDRGGKRARRMPRSGQPGDEERDVSERIALGLSAGGAAAAAARGGEAMFDSRLFEKGASQGGLGSSFGASDDVYNVYSEPLRTGAAPQGQYRPRGLGAGGQDPDATAAAIDASAAKKFGAGVTGGGNGGEDFEGVAVRRAPGPVVLEKASAGDFAASSSSSASSSAASGSALDAALSSSSGGAGGRYSTFAHIGKSGFMRAAAGSASLGGETGGSSRRKKSIEFE